MTAPARLFLYRALPRRLSPAAESRLRARPGVRTRRRATAAPRTVWAGVLR